MNIEDIREYCLSKKGVLEGFPFDDVTLVFKVMNKMFAILSLDNDHGLSLKCDPEKAIYLREQYPAVKPGYHLNKKLWNSVTLDGTINEKLLKEWVDDSYQLIVEKLTNKLKEELKKL